MFKFYIRYNFKLLTKEPDILCANCGGKLRRQKTSLDRLVEGHLYLFENVSVQACRQLDCVAIAFLVAAGFSLRFTSVGNAT